MTPKLLPLSVLFILLGVSLVVAGAFLIAFLWSASTGQFDDDYTPSVRMLFDNELKPSTKSKNDKTKHAGRKILL